MSTQNYNETVADFCRRMGWTAGTWIIGTETVGNYSRTDVIEITYVGRVRIMIEDRLIGNGTAGLIPAEPRESGVWDFSHRDWQVYKMAGA